MGISKRNPKSNFNWQYRYLKKKAICCGNLDEPVDCQALAPILQLDKYVICRTLIVTPVTITVFNTQPNQVTSFEWYFNNVLISSSFTHTWTDPTIADEGTYTIIGTNEYGCTTEYNVYLTFVAQPDPVETIVDPTPPACDGEFLITVTNPTAGVSYKYELLSSTLTVLYTATVAATSYNFTGLCIGQYAYRVTPVITTPYGTFTTCESDVFGLFNLPTPSGPAFTLEYADFNNLNLAFGIPFGYYNVIPWNILMGSDYQICVVDPVLYTIKFYYTAGSLAMLPQAFTLNINVRSDLIGVDDVPGDFISLGDQAFQQVFNLTYVIFPAVTGVGVYVFNQSPLLASVKMGSLLSVGTGMFSFCTSLDNPDIPNAVQLESGAFSGCASLVTANGALNQYWPNVVTMQSGVFSFCDLLTDVDLPVCTSMGNINFDFCVNLSVMDAPNVLSIGSQNFTRMNGLNLSLINLPLCTQLGSSCSVDNYNFIDLFAPTTPYDAASNFTLNVAASNATCNAGGPDFDLQWIIGSNPLVTINYI